jgi:hypothetical protein
MNGTEISAQEAAAFLLGIPNTMCSRQVVYLLNLYLNMP